jgi:hypothetical protein
MSKRHIGKAVLLLSFSALSAACSSDGGGPPAPLQAAGGRAEPPPPTGAAAAGAAGHEAEVVGPAAGGEAEVVGPAAGGEAPAEARPCDTARDCDDGEACNGLEACEAGACVAGAAVECSEGTACSNGRGGACQFTDTSPWIVYQADDDEPGVSELYALRRDLIGKMTPIKLNAELEPGWQVRSRDQWSPDRRLLTFSIGTRSSARAAAIEVVRFDETGPHWAQRLEGEDIQWAPSGTLLAAREAHGVAIYDYDGEGELTQVMSVRDSDATNVHGYWTQRDEYVVALTSMSTKQSWIQKLSGASGWWSARGVASNLALSHFRLSPTGTELVYEEPSSGEERNGALYAYDLFGGGLLKRVAAPGSHSFDWSADGRQFLLVQQSDDGGSQRAFVGYGSVHQNEPVQIAAAAPISSAAFAPDGQQILIRESVEQGLEEVQVLDPRVSVTDAVASLGRTGERDGGPVFSADGDLGVVQVRSDVESNVELRLFTLSDRRTARLDSIPSEQQYSGVRFSVDAQFLAYTKGADDSYEGAYVDLRYDTAASPKPVRLPGKGSVYGLEFDAEGAGLFYILEKSSGARQCFYVDLSAQVAKEPVQVSRAGRVDYCRAPRRAE